jgi:DNA-binding MarR family transcriptional regulator
MMPIPSHAHNTIPSQQQLEVWEVFLHAHAAITRKMDADFQRLHGMTLRDYEVLLYLYRAPEQGLRMSEIAERVLLTPSGITRLVKGLEEDELIERAPCSQDMRVSYARLTPTGRKRFMSMRDSHLADINALFTGRFTDAELKQLGTLLLHLPRTHEACSSQACSNEPLT